jgi:hypothetical protein
MRLPGTVEKGDKLTAEQYARSRGLTVKVLARPGGAIDLGLVRAEVVPVGRRVIRLLHEHEADEDIANLPRCPHEGCDRPVFPPSQACCGPHARGLETRGTKLSAATRRRMSAGKEFKPRPDVSERYKREWREGGPLVAPLFDRDKKYFKPVTRQRWHGRWNGSKGGRPRNEDRPDYAATILRIRKIALKNPNDSERELARKAKASREMVRLACEGLLRRP